MTYRIETRKLPMRSWNSSAAILVALNLGGPPRLSITPNTSGSGHTPSYVHRALPVFAEGFHYITKTSYELHRMDLSDLSKLYMPRFAMVLKSMYLRVLSSFAVRVTDDFRVTNSCYSVQSSSVAEIRGKGVAEREILT